MTSDLIKIALSSVSDSVRRRSQRWARLRSYYLNASTDVANDFEGANDNHYNHIQPKVDALNSYIQEVITQEKPYCEAKAFGSPDSAEVIERSVQSILDASGFDTMLGQALQRAALYNLGVLYLGVSDAERTTLEDGSVELHKPYRAKVRALEPEDFVCYPVNSQGFDDAMLVGHYIHLTREEIKEQYPNAKEIDKLPDSSDEIAGFEDIPEYGKPVIHRAVKSSHQKVRLFWGFYKEKKNWVHCIIEPTTGEKIHTEKWPLNLLPYATFRYKWPSTKDGIYGCESPANDLQGNQIILSRLANQLLDAIDAASHGMTFTDAYLASNKSAEYGFGEVVSIPGASMLQTALPHTDINAILAAMQLFETNSDGIIRISQIGQGQSDSAVDTASEVHLLAASQRAGMNAFLLTVSVGLTEVYAFYAQRFAIDIDDWGNDYAELIGIDDFSEYGALVKPVLWAPRVRSAGTTTEAAFAAIQQVYAIAQNPLSGINQYELTKIALQTLEKMSGVSLEDLQTPAGGGMLPGDMGQMAPLITDELIPGGVGGTTGVDPSAIGVGPEF